MNSRSSRSSSIGLASIALVAILATAGCKKKREHTTGEPVPVPTASPSPSLSVTPTASPTVQPTASPTPSPSTAPDGDGSVAVAPTGDAGAAEPVDPEWQKLLDDAKARKPKLAALPKKWSNTQVIEYMEQVVNPALGVKCTFCHPKGDFLAEHEHRTRALEMITMTDDLRREFFNGKAEVGCMTCHRGKKEP